MKVKSITITKRKEGFATVEMKVRSFLSTKTYYSQKITTRKDRTWSKDPKFLVGIDKSLTTKLTILYNIWFAERRSDIIWKEE